MPKEWILNSATNRWQLNFARNVGKVSEAIRNCSPRTKEDWERYYFQHIRTREHLNALGEKLYTKITEVLHAEVSEITEKDCIDYIFALVIDRTFEGYQTEKQTIYEQLQQILNVPIEPASDAWDRSYNVDFYIQINGSYIGLQIKPVSDGVHQVPQFFRESGFQAKTHMEFTKEYGGNVYYVFSIKENGKKRIKNIDVIEEIRAEIQRLSK